MSGSILKSPTRSLPDPPSPELAPSANTCDCDVPPSNGDNLLLSASSWETDGEGRSAHMHLKPSQFHFPYSKSHPNFISHTPLPKIPPLRLSYCFCGCCSEGRSCGAAGWVGDGAQGMFRTGFLAVESCSRSAPLQTYTRYLKESSHLAWEA